MIAIAAGWVNGYVTARCMKTAGYADWLGPSAFSAFMYPIIVMATIIAVDLIEWLEGSRLMPLTSVILYGVFWMSLSVGSCFHGAIVGYREKSWVSKHNPNPVLRKIPA